MTKKTIGKKPKTKGLGARTVKMLSGHGITTINPSTGQKLHVYRFASRSQIAMVVDRSAKAFQDWRYFSVKERGDLLKKIGEELLQQSDRLARLAALEMGKPLAEGIAELKKCAWTCEYFAEHAEEMLRDQDVPTEAKKSYISFQPLGPVLGIMPWNFPYWQVFRFAVPTLMAGNSVIIKHAPGTMGCALEIEKLFHKVGFPAGVYQNLIADVKHIEAVISHPQVVGVSLTGSTRAGRSVAALAGQYLKKCVLELGGSDPYVILDDADIEKAADIVMSTRFGNCGQSCVSAKRIIITPKNWSKLNEIFCERVAKKQYGDPLEGIGRLGPMARVELRTELHRQVQQSIKKGAKCSVGGVLPKTEGYFYPATLLSNVKPGQPAFDEELFGPVLALIPATSEEHAVELANQTRYGLGAAIFSTNANHAEKLAREELQAGNCFVNDFVRSDPRTPFGGIKDSGLGRELSAFGLHEFVNIKTVVVK